LTIVDEINQIIRSVLESSTWTSAGGSNPVDNFIKDLRGFTTPDLDAQIKAIVDQSTPQESTTPKTKITPVLEYGVIRIFDDFYTLDDTQTKILGGSFRVVSFEESYNILIYAENLGDNNFEVRVYIYDIDTDRSKFVFNSILTGGL